MSQSYPPQPPYGNQPPYGQPPYGQPPSGGQFGGPQGFGPPPPPRGGRNWPLIILGGLGCGGLLLVLVCCGGLYYLGSPPTASPSAQQPFEVASVPVPTLPERGNEPEELDENVLLYEVPLGEDDDGHYDTPGHGGKLWVYLPKGDHAPGSLPCVLIAPAGSTLLEGMYLSEGDQNEHQPYVEAGMAVVAYELDGFDDFELDYQAFKNSRAGLVNARNALEYALQRIPEVNPKQIFAAGHSSAANVALLFAEHEPRLAGCLAFAAPSDLVEWFGGARLRTEARDYPGMVDFVTQSSPRTHESRLNCPLFLFHAEDDSTVEVEQSKEFSQRLKALNKDVKLVIVPEGDHYDSMIEEGIPQGITWIKERVNKE